MLDWNPEQYEKFIKDRTQPAIDLANRLEVREAKRILDLGCGTGNSTKILKDKFPDAMVIGADNSDEMLAKAKKTHPDIEFIHLDVGGDLGEVKGKFDIVFSNACLQWIPNHEILLPKLMSLLRQGGVLAVQIPIQKPRNGKTNCRKEIIITSPHANIMMSFPVFLTILRCGKRFIVIVCRTMKA